MHEAFREQRFAAPPARVERLHRIVLELSADQPGARVLDLGCGTGTQLLALARALPAVRLTGVDTSAGNIEAARAAALAADMADRTDFRCADYLEDDSGPFDIVLADSVLQNLPVAESVLFAKIAQDLRPGGALVATFPHACAYNRVLWALRWMMRPLRGSVVERLLLWLARRLHPDWDPVLLAQRIPYLYMLPAHVYSSALRRRAEQEHALVIERDEAWPHASLAQPKHRLLVFRRAASP